jgi:N-acetylmuramoyl-L-alanine amidase
MPVAEAEELCGARRGRLLDRRSIALVVVTVASLLFLGTLLSPTQALASTDYHTFSSVDRYQHSVVISQAAFDPGVEAVVIAEGSDYRLATCSAPLAAAYGGPTLLNPEGFFDARVREEVARLDPDKIFVVGLGSAVVDAITASFPHLASSGSIVALNSVDPYDTTRLVAAQVKDKLGSVSGVVLVPGDEALSWAGYAAVAVSPVAAAKGWPILFTPVAGPLPASTTEALQSLGTTVVIQVATAVDPGIAGETLQTLAGGNQYDTASLIAEFAVSQGLSYDHVAVVSGYDSDCSMGLAIGAYLALDKGIALVVGAADLPAETAVLIATRQDDIHRVDFSGPVAETCEWIQFLLGSSVPTGFAFPALKQRAAGLEVVYLEGRLASLSYRPGPIDGVFDKRTRQAVIAFQKWEGLRRNGILAEEAWQRLLVASRPKPKMEGSGTWIEVDRTRQVLLYCVDGTVQRTLTTSTGNPAVEGGFTTPAGEYAVSRENTWERFRYKPLYLRKGGVWAIHGYFSVPVYPASHGCIRIPIWDMEELHALVPIGTKVYIY